MSLALYHHQLLNVYFTRSFYKHILGIVPLTDCLYTLSTNFNVHVHAEIKLRDKVLANYKNLNFVVWWVLFWWAHSVSKMMCLILVN